MEYKGLWEDKKKPVVVFEVVEYHCYEYLTTIDTALCASLLDAHFEFKERVEKFKKEAGCFDEDGNVEVGYVYEESEDCFVLYKDGRAANYDNEIWIKKKEVVSNY